MKKIVFSSIIIYILLLFSCTTKGISYSTIPDPVIKNPSFDIEHMGWASHWHKRSLYEADRDVEYVYSKDDTHTGDGAIEIHSKTLNDCRVYQYVTVKPETIYKITCRVKAKNITGGNIGACISILDSGAHSQYVKDTNGEWVQLRLYGMTAPYQTRIPVACRIGMWGVHGKGRALFDDISIEVVRTKPQAYVGIQSFAFNYTYGSAKADKYFEKIENPRYASKNLHISIFLAFLIFILTFCFFLYSWIIKKKSPGTGNLFQSLVKKCYPLLIGIFLTILFVIYITRSEHITVFDIQFTLILFFLTACGIILYLYRYNNLTTDNLIKIIILLGLGLRICYFLYTAYTDPGYVRQHDLWGEWSHTYYIKYIADHFVLPPVGTHEAYHPPVHYILSAIVFNIARLFRLNEIHAFRAIQLYLVFLSTLITIVTYKIFKRLECNKKVMLFGIAFVCFLPSLIFMSVYLNNDCTVAFFFCISFYYLIKVVHTKKIKHTILLAVFTALAILSKKTALILFPLCGIVFLIELFKNKQEYRHYIKLGVIFLLIAVPFGLSFQIRNYILFQQDLSFSVPVTGPVMPGNPYHLFYVSIEKLLEHPFVLEDGAKRIFIFMELIRTSLFSAFEFRLPLQGFEDAASLLMIFYLFNLVLLIIFFITSKKHDYKGKTYILLINFIILTVFYIQMHFASPYFTTHAFRYIAPFISISLGYFIGQANVKFGNVKYPVLRILIKVQFILWCLASVLFIYLTGF